MTNSTQSTSDSSRKATTNESQAKNIVAEAMARLKGGPDKVDFSKLSAEEKDAMLVVITDALNGMVAAVSKLGMMISNVVDEYNKVFADSQSSLAKWYHALPQEQRDKFDEVMKQVKEEIEGDKK